VKFRNHTCVLKFLNYFTLHKLTSSDIIILYFSILLHCIVQWVLQVMLPSACSFIVEVSCHCFTLNVSAYMAIFKCVGCYYSHVLEETCFAGFSESCTWLHFARGYAFIRFHLWGGLNMRYYLLLFMLF
jgi:hypothetical protein